jgi:UrcA family protein
MLPAGVHGPAVQPKTKETMMFRAFTTASILALSVTTAQAASDVEVQFGDLDLSSPSQASILQERIKQASNKVCGPLLWSYPSPPSLFYPRWFKDCVNATSAETTRRVEARAGQYLTFASN